MVEGPGREHGEKVQISVTVSREMYEWAFERVGAGEEFKDFTHAVERGLRCLKEREEGEG